jgi:3-hydroxyisobutyrate dehydrogenase
MKIGFIGLGKMGYGIARNISKKFKVSTWNRTRLKSVEHNVKHGTICFNESRDIIVDSNIIVLCLPTHKEVSKILLDDFIPKNKIIIDCSSSDPFEQIKLHDKLKGYNTSFLDCPVSGGPTKANAGTLSCMVGGDRDKYEEVKNVLETFSVPTYVGKTGNGCLIKSVNNLFNVTQLCIAAEGLYTLERSGIDIGVALEVLNKSSGRSLMTTERFPIHVLEKNCYYGFTTAFMLKDVRIAMNNIKNPVMFNNVLKLLEKTEELYGGGSDYTEITKLFTTTNKNNINILDY